MYSNFWEEIKFPYNTQMDSTVNIEILINHSGKKLTKKRCAMRQFEKNFPLWQYEDIVEKNIDTAYEIEKQWQSINTVTDEERKFVIEIFRKLHNSSDVNFYGIILNDGNNNVGYSISAQLSEDAAIILVLRTVTEVSGLVPMLYRETARALFQHIPQLQNIDMGAGGSAIDIQNRNSYL